MSVDMLAMFGMGLLLGLLIGAGAIGVTVLAYQNDRHYDE